MTGQAIMQTNRTTQDVSVAAGLKGPGRVVIEVTVPTGALGGAPPGPVVRQHRPSPVDANASSRSHGAPPPVSYGKRA